MNSDVFRSDCVDLILKLKLDDQLESWLSELLPRVVPNSIVDFKDRRILLEENNLLKLVAVSDLGGLFLRTFIEELVHDAPLPNKEVDVLTGIHYPNWEREKLCRKLSNRDFYGNFLPSLEILLKRVVGYRLEKPIWPKCPQRHRGYRDKGSLRPISRWLPKSDYQLTSAQNDLEEFQDFRAECLSWNLRVLSKSRFGRNSDHHVQNRKELEL